MYVQHHQGVKPPTAVAVYANFMKTLTRNKNIWVLRPKQKTCLGATLAWKNIKRVCIPTCACVRCAHMRVQMYQLVQLLEKLSFRNVQI